MEAISWQLIECDAFFIDHYLTKYTYLYTAWKTIFSQEPIPSAFVAHSLPSGSAIPSRAFSQAKSALCSELAVHVAPLERRATFSQVSRGEQQSCID